MGPPLVGSPRLLIQYIRSYPPYWGPFLYPQPENAPCRGDRDPLIAGSNIRPNYYLTLCCRNYFFLILAHPVYKMWIIQEPNKLAWWNKLHFEEKKTESIEHVSNIQYLHLLNKYIKCNVWWLAVRYDLYIGR